MWSKPGIALALLALLAVLLAACDWFVGYTVVNQTDHPVTAWILFESCDTVIGQDGEYDYQRLVAPGEPVEVSDVTGKPDPEPWCVQVVDEQRRLLLSEPYDYLKVYVVTDDLRPGLVVPQENELPGESLGEQLSETGPVYLVFFGITVLFGLAIVAGILFATAIAIRSFYQRYADKR